MELEAFIIESNKKNKKYPANKIEFIKNSEQSLKKLIENKEISDEEKKNNAIGTLEKLKDDIEQLSNHDEQDDIIDIVQQDLGKIITSLKKENLGKKSFNTQMQALPNAIHSIYIKFSCLVNNIAEIRKLENQVKALKFIQDSLSNVKRSIHSSETSECTDKLILTVLTKINSMPNLLLIDQTKLNVVIKCLFNTLLSKDSNLFKAYLVEKNSYSRIIKDFITVTSSESDSYFKKLQSIDSELFLIRKVCAKEIDAAYATPMHNIKQQFNELSKVCQNSETTDSKVIVEAIRLCIEHTSIDLRIITQLLFYINDYCDTLDNSKKNLLINSIITVQEAIETIKFLEYQILDLTAHDELQKLCSKVESIVLLDNSNALKGAANSVISEDLSISKDNKEKIKIKMSILRGDASSEKYSSELPQFADRDVKNFKKNLESIEELRKSYMKSIQSDPAKKDQDFENLLSLGSDHFENIIAFYEQYQCEKYYQADVHLISLIPIIKDKKIPRLSLTNDDQILFDEKKCSIGKILSVAAESENWKYNREEWKSHSEDDNLRNLLRKKFFTSKKDLTKNLEYYTYNERQKAFKTLKEEAAYVRSEVNSDKAVKEELKAIETVLNEKNLLGVIETAQDLLKQLKKQNIKKDKNSNNPYDAFQQEYDKQLIDYAIMITKVILDNQNKYMDNAECNIVYRLAMLRCISVLGETFNSLLKNNKNNGISSRDDYKTIIKYRNALQHFSTTKNGPDKLQEFLAQGYCQPSKKSTDHIDGNKKPIKKRDCYKIYSPLKTIERVLEQLEVQETVMQTIKKHDIDEQLLVFAWEYLVTFIGGDLIRRLESNPIFTENFKSMQIFSRKSSNGNDAINVLAVLEQVRIYRNGLSHAHLSLDSSSEKPMSLGTHNSDEFLNDSNDNTFSSSEEETSYEELAEILGQFNPSSQRTVKVKKADSEILLFDQLKPVAQLCWAILMLTNADRKLYDNLEEVIMSKQNEFAKYLDIEANFDDNFCAAVEKALNKLVYKYGKPHLDEEVKKSFKRLHKKTNVLDSHEENSKDTIGLSYKLLNKDLRFFKEFYKEIEKAHQKHATISCKS